MVVRIAASKSHAALHGFITLLGSSAIAAVGLALLASRQWPALDQESTTKFLLILQWQLGGVLVCKGGTDQIIFSRTSQDPALQFDVSALLRRFVIPCALVYSLILVWLFSPSVGIACFTSIVLDIASIMAAADANARRRHTRAAIGTLLNYPPFFALLWLCTQFWSLTETQALWLFCVSSATRFAYFYASAGHLFGRARDSIKPTSAIALQPILNYLAFRMDYVALTLLIVWLPLELSASWTSQYMFLAKFPELLSGVFVQAGLVIFPRITARSLSLDTLAKLGRQYWQWILGSVIMVAIGAAVYIRIYADEDIPEILIVPFAIHALLVFPVNLVTFLMLQKGSIEALIVNLFLAILLGVAWVIAIGVFGDWTLLAWLVPLQLSVLVLLGIVRPLRQQVTHSA